MPGTIQVELSGYSADLSMPGTPSYCADPPDCALSPMLMNATIKLEK